MPAAVFLPKIFTTRWRDAVILCFTVVFGRAPERSNQPLIFEPMQRRIKRAVLDLQNLLRGLLDDMRDSVSVSRAQQDGLENKDVERPLKEISSFVISAFTWHQVYADLIPQERLPECGIQ